MYVASGTSKITVSECGWSGTPFHPGSLTVILEVPFATYLTTLPPDDRLLMLKICRGILIQ
jgi:hypothetical protein